MPTTCRALGVAVGTRVLQHFFFLLQLGPSCLLRSLLVSHSEVGAADSINTYSVCSPFAVQISIHLLPICSSSAGVQQSPCSPSPVPHRQLHRQFAHSCCDDHLITIHCLELMQTVTSQSAASWVIHRHSSVNMSEFQLDNPRVAMMTPQS